MRKHQAIQISKENKVIAKRLFEIESHRERYTQLGLMFLPDKDLDEIVKAIGKMENYKVRKEEILKESGEHGIEKITRRAVRKRRTKEWLDAHPDKTEKDVPTVVVDVLEDLTDLSDEEGEYIGDLWEEY